MSLDNIAGITSIVLSVASFVLAIIGNFWCNYAFSTVTLTSNINPSNSTSFNVYRGIWNFKYTSTYYYSDGSDIYSTSYASCSGYSGAYITADTKWNSAKAFSIIAVCIGGIAMIASCAAMGKPKLWMIVSMLLLITTLSQGLTFLFFSSNACVITAPLIDTQGTSSSAIDATYGNGCGLAAAAKLGITATVFWFFSALAAGVAGVGGKKTAEGEHNEVNVKQEYTVEQSEEAVKEEY